MTPPEELNAILDRIVKHQQTETDMTVLRQWLSGGGQIISQQGKYAVNLGQGQEVHIGDKIYQGADAEVIREIVRSILEELKATAKFATSQEISPPSSQYNQLPVDDLVQQVRSLIHDSIQSLHGTMPLWGIDNWVPLGDLFVDVNILESLSSNRRWELGDLWQDFTTGNSNYHSLDRIGLGKEQQRVSGLTVLERNRNLMVVGKPGSGKTTYVQRIVTECNNGRLQAQRIPVLIKLREFVDDGRRYSYNLEQFLGQLWRLSNADMELVLNQGKALVLLDGLDEVTGEAGTQISKEIKRFARAYPQVLVMVTCRTQSQESRFDRFDDVEVADFNEQQVRAFAEHWFGTICGDTGKNKAREFLEQLFREENKPIRELAITPILLSLTCAVFQQTGKFYSKRSKLYEEGLELLLVQWDKSREVQRDEVYRDLSVERKLELLSYLAVKKFEQEQYVLFEQEELERYIGEFLGIERRESQGVLRAIASQHGLLIERSYKVWSFSHLTFQEYLVATWFCKQPNWDKSMQYIAEKSWREVFILIAEMLTDANCFFQLLKKQIDMLISSDLKLQHFLTWVNDVSQNVQIYRKELIRAYYLELAQILNANFRYKDFDKGRHPILVLACACEIDAAIKISSRLNINQDNQQCYYLAAILSASQGLIRECQNDLDYRFNYDTGLELTRIINSNISSLLTDARRFAYDLFPRRYNGEFPDTRIEELLQDCDNTFLRKLYYWCPIGNTWTKLQLLMVENLNIGADWKFNNEQNNILEKYYEANKTLVISLNNSNALSNSVKEEIKGNLLLPIAEIEKRKRER